MTVVDVRPPEDVPKLLALVRSTQTDLSPPSTWRHRKKDGTVIEVEIASHLISFDGHDARLVLINDVTDRKALEAELMRAQRFESVGRLASGIAHDMNNILAPVMIAAPMLRMGLSQAEREKIVSTIELSARRGAELVRQLLIFGRGVDVRDGAVDVARVIADLTRVIGETFPKSIAIAAHVADDLWRVRGEATQIHQILLNLCVNARDAMPRGGSLTIRADNIQLDGAAARRGRNAEPGAYVRLCVTDTGAGIPADIADKIFDPFFTTKPLGEGTGLGLATVVGIVKSQGGSLSFDSHVGQGTAFEVLLPAQFGAAARIEVVEPSIPPPGNRETILVVDDEANIRSVLSGALSRHNYEVLAAADGAEAAAVFARHVNTIKLVIADIDMPFIDGVTLTKVLRNLNPTIKVILSTGTVNARAMAQAAEFNGVGFTSVLGKPYTAARVLAVVHEALHGETSKRSGSSDVG